MSPFTYGELETGGYAKLTPCPYCAPARRKADIDKQNQEMGIDPDAAKQGEPVISVGESSLDQTNDVQITLTD